MKKQLLLWVALLLSPFFSYSQCTTTNATSCACKDGTTNCQLLPDIKVARPPLLVNGSSGYLEYPQTCNPPCSGNDGRLRVSVSTPNIGFGPLEVRTTPTAICGTDTFYNVPSNFTCPNGQPLRQILNQRVYQKNGNTMSYIDRFAGSMTYHPSHGHMHVDDWGIYTLRTATADPNPLNWPVVGTGSKLAFCLMDYGTCSYYNGHCVDSANNTMLNGNFPNFGLGGGNYGCSSVVQGISSGYTDIYYQSLDGMWINLPPGLCNGTYWMVIQLDPYNYFLESDETNNVLAVQVTLTQQGGTLPVVTASGSTTFCQGGSVSLTASSATNYLWSNGATTQSITVSQSGSYSVTVNTGTSCVSTSAPTTVTVSQIPVTATATPANICAGEAVQLGASATGGGTSNQVVTYTNNTIYNIPDNNATGISSYITVNNIDPVTINSNTVVSVQLDITHTYDGDLQIQLIAPSGNAINLSNRRGGSGNNFTNSIFIGSAALSISQGSAPFNGSYRPDGPFTSLTGNSNGTWTLKIMDLAGTDIGTLNYWTLKLNDVVPTTISYNWTSLPAGFTSGDQTTTANPTQSTTYTVTATESGTGCQGTQTVNVVVGNGINVTANTPAPICAGQTANLSVNGANSYVWSPATGLSGTTGNAVTASPSQTTTYTVIGTTNGCSDTAFVTVVVNPLPVINTSSGSSICAGSSVTLQATGAPNLSWSPATGLNTTSGNSVVASPDQTTTYTVTGSDNGCSNSATVTVSVNALPVVTASANTSVCAGQSTTLNASGASSYNWSPSAGLNQTTGASVNASPAVNTTYTVIGSDNNGCTASATVTVDVIDLPIAPTSIVGAVNHCLPMSASFAINPIGNATSYTWSAPAGMSLSGQGTSNVTVNATGASSGDLCVISNNSCGSSAPRCVAVTANSSVPVRPGTVSGTGKACAGDVIAYSIANVANTNSYLWSNPAGTSILSGQGTHAISLQFNAGYAGGTLSVQAVNGCGNSLSRVKALSLNIPATTSVISGHTTGLCNSQQTYSVMPVVGMTYNWSVPSGATIINGQGTNSIQVQFGAGFTNGNVSVNAQNACGTSTARVKSVKAAPAIPASITGPASVCQGQQGVNYTAATVYGATSYTWTAPTNATIAAGQGTLNASVNYAMNSVSSKIKVNASNACSTSSNKTKSIVLNSCIKVSDFTTSALTGLSLLPNPATTYVEVQFNSNSDQPSTLRVTNVLGQEVYTQSIHPSNGINNYMVDVRKLNSGVYIVSILQDGKSFAQRLVVE